MFSLAWTTRISFSSCSINGFVLGARPGARAVTELSSFTFEVLRQDEQFILSRGSSADGASRVLLRSPTSQHPALQNLKGLQKAYSFKDDLDSAWAVRPIEFANHWDRTVLVMEDPGGVPLDQLPGHSFDLVTSLRIAAGLSSAIGHLHRRGIIHKDIKPAHVLVTPSTGECRLMGFGISSRLPRERQSLEPPEFIAGTLPYMAPEQTGRMNRSVDSRSDLYSFGVVLYEMLTGSLPFAATTPMEWVHCHIARQPVPPSQRVTGVPAAVSAIVMKLLAKTAEARYQTAIGVEYDLRQCLDELEGSRPRDPFVRRARIRLRQPERERASETEATSDPAAAGRALPADGNSEREIEQTPEFPLGTRDIPDRLRIPEKLYGREDEIETLLQSFERIVRKGKPELVLVSGYSGIGKSSVVNELHKALVAARGLFATGKFDQYKRDIPYSTFAQAFQGLIRQLLGKNDSELAEWRDAFREALHSNGQLIIDLIPELGLILGQQAPVPELPPQDAQHRFRLVFRRFISVLARPDHPLVLFLDDLQWLDAASLDLLEDLSTHPEVQHLMLIGAYRDNEVRSTHQLARTLEAIRQAGAIVHEIILAPLTRQDLGHLISDSLHYEPENWRSRRMAALARLVHEKTGGNPFFAIQFISALAEESSITFDHNQGKWSWDLNRIQAKGHTDNVVDLMVGKLIRLPVETQQTLKEFACLGNSAEITTLSIVHGTSEAELHSDLWEALRMEFIERFEGSYKFVHDRIQEAAYSLVPVESRAEAHLRIGGLLAKHTPPERLEETVFEIVNQLNRGAVLISSFDEREQLAELNLLAGKRAKASTAFASALKYLATGASLLDDSAWDHRHDLVFALELNLAECEFLTSQTAVATERLTRLSSRAIDTVELAEVTCLRIDHHTALDQIGHAVDVFLDYFRRLGVEWSRHPTQEQGRREYQRIWSQLGTRTIEELVDLPLMMDPASLGTLDVLSKIYVPAVFTDANLLSWTVCYAVNLSLERGNSDASCLAYVWLGKIAGAYFGDHQAGIRFGQLSQELIKKRSLKRFQAQTYLWFAQNIAPLTNHLRNCRELIRWAFESATKSGEITTASYSFDILTTNLLAAGDSLVEAQRQAEDGIVFSGRSRAGFGSDLISGQLGLIRSLRGLNEEFGHLDDGQHSEAELECHFTDQADRTVPACWYWIRKLQARFFSGDYVSAIAAAEKARSLLWSSPAHFETVEYHFFSGLSHAAWSDFGPADEQRQHLSVIVAHYGHLKTWANHCPENFADRAALIGAEIARMEGRIIDAMDLYEQAIRSAQVNGFTHNEALANELAARFYTARGFDKIANQYLRDARYGYLRWGADGKVRQLDQLYPQLRLEAPRSGLTGTIETPVEHLDLATILKVSQAVSGEIVMEKLIDMLMRTAIEHAGAERGVLVLPHGDQYRIEAEAATAGDRVVVRVPEMPAASSAVPDSLIHYVVRTQESLIIEDAVAENAFSRDSYFRQQQARSVLCLPLINQAKLIAVLYLENNLAPRIFTPARMTVLKLLAAQAAISLENTRLYRDLEKRETALQRTQAELAHVSRLTTMGELAASIAHEVNQPLVGVVTNASASLRYLDWDTPNLVETREATQAILRDANRAADVISRMRGLFKRARPSKQPLNVNEAIEEVALLTRGEARRHRVALQLEVAENLPLVMADRVQIQQVVMNLILNGIQAMSAVSDRERILTIRTQGGESNKIRVAVQDCGIGIDPVDIERVFDAFHTTKSDGMGMGLSISRSIVENHGGELWATPNDGPGVTFQFSL
jgi:predicted ATPase/signal transduction histidine kinase